MSNFNYKYASVCVFILFSIFILILVFNWKVDPRIGESDTNMLATVSIMNSGSFFVNEDDYSIAQKDFPETFLNKGLGFNDVSLYRFNGKAHIWYFPTYSILVLPAKYLFKLIGVPLYKSFFFTNAIFIIISLLVVLLCLKLSEYIKFWLIIFLATSPTVMYYTWPSSEVCIFMFIVLSLVFFYNKEYKRSALFISIASTMNPVVAAFGFLIIACHFLDIFKDLKIVKFQDIIKNNFKNTLALAASFIPAFIPFIYNYITIGKLNPTAGMATSHQIFERFFSYLFDLNFSFFAFYPLLVPMLFLLFFASIFKKNIKLFISICIFFLIVLLYSVAEHINCGMEGVHRYNSFTLPILLFIVFANYKEIFYSDSLKIVFNTILVFSLFLVALINLFDYKQVRYIDVRLNLPARVVMETFPSIYNPMHSIFITRSIALDRSNTRLNAYVNYKGYVKKILFTPNSSSDIIKKFKGDEKSKQYLKAEIEKIKAKDNPQYVNIPHGVKLTMSWLASMLVKNGERTADEVKVNPNGIFYGPYIYLKKGIYKVTFEGSFLGELYFDVLLDTTVNIPMDIIKKEDNIVEYTFQLTNDTKNVEFRLINNTDKIVSITGVFLENVSD